MSNPNNHIGIFEELIRVLTIKKRSDFELMDKTEDYLFVLEGKETLCDGVLFTKTSHT